MSELLNDLEKITDEKMIPDEEISDEEMNPDEELFPDEKEKDASFVVDDDRKAEWCLRKIREAEEEKKKWKAFYKERSEKICRAADSRIERLTLHLARYFSTVPHRVSDTQESYPLPNGKLVMKKREVKYEYQEEEVLGWLEDQGITDFTKMKKTLDWNGLKKTLTIVGGPDGRYLLANADGEFVPGVEAVVSENAFKVEGLK